jgi:hypothetical protein
MTDALSGELLILILLILTCSRIFFSRRINTDSLSLLSVIALILSFLQILAWGATLQELLVFTAAILVFISNIHALSRLNSQLLVDVYSPLFITVSILLCLILLLLSTLLVVYRPVNVDPESYHVKVTRHYLSGNFQYGFNNDAAWYEKKDAETVLFTPETEQAGSGPILLFIPDKRASLYEYFPYLLNLSSLGVTVLAADFYTADGSWLSPFQDNRLIRPTALLLHSLYNKNFMAAHEKAYTENMCREYAALFRIAKAQFSASQKYFLVSDGMTAAAAAETAAGQAERCSGYFLLQTVPEFKYPGYGCIEQMNIPLAVYFGLHRDPEERMPRYLAQETIAALKK